MRKSLGMRSKERSLFIVGDASQNDQSALVMIRIGLTHDLGDGNDPDPLDPGISIARSSLGIEIAGAVTALEGRVCPIAGQTTATNRGSAPANEP